jgi:ABC-type branched-subunit amino acid transport system substrate-binding protein
MRRKWMALVCLVLIICTAIPMSLLSLGCGGGEEATENVTITIGDLTDLTGPGASAMKPISWALEDYCNYVNEEGLCKGVTFKVVSYDTKYDPSRFSTGYDDLKSQGANIIFTGPPAMADSIKQRAEIDEMPVICASATANMVDNPGWVFTLAVLDRYRVPVFLDWLTENDWEGTGPAKIGLVGYSMAPSPDAEAAVKAYCQTHTDQYTLVGTTLVPMGTMTWSAEVQTYKDCDYLFIAANGGTMSSTFVDQYRDAGGKAKLIGSDAFNAYVGAVTDKAGWAAVDGSLTYGNWGYWTLESTEVDLIKELLEKNHPGDAAALMKVGSGAVGGGMDAHMAVLLLMEVVKKIGTKDLTGKAIYDALQEVTAEAPGFYPVSYPDGQRQGARFIHVQRWSAADQTLNIITDWMEVPTD